MSEKKLYPEICNSNECPVPQGYITTGEGICGPNCEYWKLRQATIKAYLDS